ncbi:sensor histidine kinase [Metabacillus arenae]|uniref:Sensor histidine kinase n=1 Tax=Metabacillus arenae TaxID=2771434 RepID=A0A926NDM0_9BACI|nr:sensor histidine kinase [Metabacillus arenae]MBD1379569.1 sensor histidine kinase [Metabacillus arenae]
MNTVFKQVILSVFLSLFLFTVLSIAYFTVFPLTDWTYLWEQKIIDLPFIVVLPVVSILLGSVFGLVSGFLWQKQLRDVDGALQQLEQGRQVEEFESSGTTELESIWFRIKKVQNQMAEQTKLSQKLANEKAEDQERRVQEIVYQERQRLARELHDSVSQQLFAASMLMSAINESRNPEDERETKQLKMVEEMIHQSQLEMRALLLHLRPVALKGKTLQEGMEELLAELSQKVPMEVKWKFEEIELDKGIEDHLFRILQESVSNTLRHAKAESLDVLLIQRDNFIILRVVDDGIGFNIEEEKTGSYGLQNMYERAVELGGALKVVSLPKKGTRLEVRVPMIKHVEKGVSDDNS